MPTFPVLANNGAMSQFVGAFEVISKLTGNVYQCRFSHMWNGIATRHSDTIDTKFYVDGEALVVGLSHTGFVKFREKDFARLVRPRSKFHRRGVSERTFGRGRPENALRRDRPRRYTADWASRNQVSLIIRAFGNRFSGAVKTARAWFRLESFPGPDAAARPAG